MAARWRDGNLVPFVETGAYSDPLRTIGAIGMADNPGKGADPMPHAEIKAFLIADVRGYTLFTQQRGDEAAGQLASRFAAVARDVIEAGGGTLAELRGDEALAVFNSPRRAIRAAVNLQARFVEESIADPEFSLPVGIGLDAGEAVPVAGGYRGGALNLAARLCGMAAAGDVLASREIVHLATKIDGVTYTDLGDSRFKGLPDPIHVIRVAADGLDPPAFFASYARGDSTGGRAARRGPLRRIPRPVLIALALSLVVSIAYPIVHQGNSGFGSIGANAVGVIDLATRRIVGSIPVGVAPTAIASGAGFIWVANSSDATISKIDPDTKSVVDTIPVDRDPSSIAYGAGAIWVAASGDGFVDQIDLRTDTIVRRIPVGQGAAAVAVGAGVVWVVAGGDAEVLRIDPQHGREIGRTRVGTAPSGIVIADFAWVTNTYDDTVSRISLDTGESAGTVHVGGGPDAIAASDAEVWVANSLDGTVSRIDPSRNTVTATIPVGDGPSAVVMTGGATWVLNQFAASITDVGPGAGSGSVIAVGNRPVAGVAVNGELWTVTQASPASHRGGTLRIVGPSPDSIDPAAAFNSWAWQILLMTNDGLVGFRRAGGLAGTRIVPDLAVSLPTPSDGGRTYTFQLRPGVRFSTGRVVKPKDVRAGLERSIQAGPGRFLYSNIVGADRCQPDVQCDLSLGVVTDETSASITFHLVSPDALFPYKLAFPFASAVPDGTPYLGDESSHPAGTGPYMIASYEPGVSLELVRNPHFQEWSAAAQPDGFPDSIAFAFGRSTEEGLGLVERGSADYLFDTGPYSVEPALTARLAGLTIRHPSQIHRFGYPQTRYVWLNTKDPPFDSVLVRRAVNYAVDRARVARIFGGRLRARPTCQILPPGIPGYEPYCPYTVHPALTGRWSAPDLSVARDLIARSGTKGLRVDVGVFVPEGNGEAGRYLASVLDTLGYDARFRGFQVFDRLGNELSAGHIDAWVTAWYADLPVASSFLTDLTQPCAAPVGQLSNVCDSSLRRSIDRAADAQQDDPASAPGLWARADHASVDQALWVPLVDALGVDFVSSRVGNYQRNPQFSVLLDQLWVR